MKIAGTLTASLIVGACLAAPTGPAAAHPAPVTVITSGLAAGTADPATATSGGLVVTLPVVPSTDLLVGDVVPLLVTVDAPDATRVRFQTRPDATSGWVDASFQDVPVGTSDHDFAVPTVVPGALDGRVVVDPSAGSPQGYQSTEWHFTVTAAPLGPLLSTVTLTTPPAATVPVGTRSVLRGRVSGDAGRTAGLELGTPTGWLPLAQASTDADGAYALALPTDWFYRGRLRIRVPGTTSYTAATSATFGTGVVPSYAPLGATRDWGLTVPGVRWNPCGGTISYQVNLAGAPARRLTQLRQALRLVHEATGLRFAYAGSTTAVPYRTDGGTRQRSDADFTIALAGAQQVRQFRTTVVGLGGFAWRGNEIVHGLVVLDRDARLRDSFGVGQTWGTLMLHEIGHAVGLAHAGGLEQVMHSGISSRSRGSYQAGDLTGLRHEGALGGCVAPWLGRGGAPRVTVAR